MKMEFSAAVKKNGQVLIDIHRIISDILLYLNKGEAVKKHTHIPTHTATHCICKKDLRKRTKLLAPICSGEGSLGGLRTGIGWKLFRGLVFIY